jgi:WD40 repeat protein/serine/threonine protein kinase
MLADERLVDFLMKAEEWQKDGRPFTIGELCPDPELWPMLAEALDGFKELNHALRLPDLPTISTLPQAVAVESFHREIRGYEIIEEIGRGGMGVVYKARQLSLNRLVALKMILAGAHASTADCERFRREAEAVARLGHPNVVQIHEVGEQDGVPFLCLEYVEGGSMADRLDGRPHPVDSAAEFVETLARTIHHAHQQGIVHRDLKPANVLLTAGSWQQGGGSESLPADSRLLRATPKITDFGLAKRLDLDGNSTTQRIAGTPSYMAPEQVQRGKEPIGPAVDIYALGVILYELLTGRVPFKGNTALDTVLQVLNQDPMPPSCLRPALPADLETICLRCLAREPARRYATALDVAEDLRRFLDGRPILARRTGKSELFWRWCRRNPRIAGLTAAVFALLMLVALVASIGYVRESELRKQAETQRELANLAEIRTQEEAANTGHLFYIANMSLAPHYWESGNGDQLRRLLADNGTHPNRGFEWAYWHRQAYTSPIVYSGLEAPVLALALCLDGKQLVVAGENGVAKIVDSANGRELVAIDSHAGPIYTATFSHDGQRLLTAGKDGVARTWNANSGKALATFRGHTQAIRSAAFSADGSHIVTGGDDKMLRLWDASTGRELMTREFPTGITAVSYCPDNRRVAVGTAWGSVGLVDIITGKESPTTGVHNDLVSALAFESDGSHLVSASWDREVKTWGTASGQNLALLSGHAWNITSLAYSKDGQRLVTGSYDRTAVVWDVASGRPIWTLKGHSGPIHAVALSADGNRVFTGSADKTARIWDISRKAPISLPGKLSVQSLALSPHGDKVALGGGQGTTVLWVISAARPLVTLPRQSREVFCISFSPDGARLATSSLDRVAKIWDSATGELLLTLEGHTAEVTGVAFSPDGKRLVTASLDQTAKIWDAPTGRLLQTLRGHGSGIRAAVYAPDSRHVLTGGWDWTVRQWDGETGELKLTLKGHRQAIVALAWSPDGRFLASSSWDRTVRIWEAATGKKWRVLRDFKTWASALAFSPDGRRLLTATHTDSRARLWDIQSGRETLALQHDALEVAAFSADGLRIVTASLDGSVKVWDAASPRQIADWHAQEEDNKRQLDEAARERLQSARDDGFVLDWLVLAPIPLVAGQTTVDAVDAELIPSEADLHPSEGEEVIVGGKPLTWRKCRAHDYCLDLNALLEERVQYAVAYAVACLHSDTERRGLTLKVGSDDQSKVYVNGRAVHKALHVRGLRRDEDVIEGVSLRKGENVIVFKIINQEVDWKGCLRFLDKGRPIRTGASEEGSR